MPILPVARNTNYTPASAVKSADLNDLQDCIVGRKKPPWTRSFWPKPVIQGPFIQALTLLCPSFMSNLTVAGTGIFEVPCEAGDRIIGFTSSACGNGSVDATLNVCYAANMAGFTNPITLSTVDDVNHPQSWADVTMTPFIPQVIEPGGGLYFAVTVTQPGYSIGLLHATFDRL